MSYIAISPLNATLAVGESLALRAYSPSDSSMIEKARWSSSNPLIASVAPEEGLVTAHRAGTVRMYAETLDGRGAADCLVTVEESIPVEEIIIQAEKVDPENLKIGDRFRFTATVLPTNATDKVIHWESSDPSVADIDFRTGRVTVHKEGTTTVSALATDKSEVYAFLDLTVTEPK